MWERERERWRKENERGKDDLWATPDVYIIGHSHIHTHIHAYKLYNKGMDTDWRMETERRKGMP